MEGDSFVLVDHSRWPRVHPRVFLGLWRPSCPAGLKLVMLKKSRPKKKTLKIEKSRPADDAFGCIFFERI